LVTALPRPTVDASPRTQRVVLAGNPNVGKSAIFNALTGLNAEVSNYPGTTIDISRGKLGSDELTDTPGVYGVSSFNDEERIARKLIVDADIVVNVVSALSLDRDLFLTLQLIDLGKPMIVVINQYDEAAHYGLTIDSIKLEQLLGVPITCSVAIKRQGIARILELLPSASIGVAQPEVLAYAENLIDQGCSRELAVLCAEGDEVSATTLGAKCGSTQSAIYKLRRGRVDSLYEQVVSRASSAETFGTRLGRFLLHPIYGSVSAILVCYLIFYQLLGVVVAGNIVNFTEKDGLCVYYEPPIRRVAACVFPSTVTVGDKKFVFPSGTLADPMQSASFAAAASTVRADKVKYDFWSVKAPLAVAGNLLVGEYGILTLTVTYLIGLLMPLVLGFYLGLSILEDSGYLPRLAVIVDRWLNKIGLNGRAVIPLVLGLGCVTMATVTTRLLTTKREKIIATALLGVAIPCSAQLGIVSGTLARCGGLLPWVVYGTVVGGILGLTGLLLHSLMPGKSQPLMIDLPPMRLPRANNVLKKTWTKSWNFMQESIPMFCIAGVAVTLAQMTGLLDAIIRVLQPVTVQFLGLPADPRIPTTFILGIVRRDFAAFGLTDVSMTAVQAVVAMIVITLFVPCIATVGVMIKERGMKVAMSIWFGSWVAAFIIGGALARVLPPLFKALGS
jgi:ferrous iron transport protein B